MRSEELFSERASPSAARFLCVRR